MQDQNLANGTSEPEGWQAISWRKVYRQVRHLRQRIFKAEQAGDHQKVKSLQKLMLRSHANTLLSVRRVTQVSSGSKTAGIDKVVVKTPKARMDLVKKISQYQPWKAKPVRRVYIPKSNGKRRPLGIPTIEDRVMQARVKNALEPQWEARFEGSSYGFRPGRGCHDAVSALYGFLNSRGKRKWILDADIRGAFDHIDHEFLLKAIEGFPARGLIKQWLKAGFVEGGIKKDTTAGTPQGGVISPLLANIALHGMEKALGVQRTKEGKVKAECRAVIRYADDFVVLCNSRNEAEQAREDLSQWLTSRGLELSEEKTRVVHLTEGFNFLGFNFKQYSDHRSPRGHKLLIKPSRESVEKLKTRLKQEWKALTGAITAAVIRRLAPIVQGWAMYFRTVVSSKIFTDLDHWMFKRSWRYAKRKHPWKSSTWIYQRYFGKRNPTRQDQWVFGDDVTGKYLIKFAWTKIKRHVMVKGTSSPDDPALKAYWLEREKKTAPLTMEPHLLGLAKLQGFCCPVCGESLLNGELLERHHMVLDRKDARRKDRNYQRLLHLYCHDQVHGGQNTPELARQLIVLN